MFFVFEYVIRNVMNFAPLTITAEGKNRQEAYEAAALLLTESPMEGHTIDDYTIYQKPLLKYLHNPMEEGRGY